MENRSPRLQTWLGITNDPRTIGVDNIMITHIIVEVEKEEVVVH